MDKVSDFTGDVRCSSVQFDEELMYFTVYSDINDAEGIIFEGFRGTEWVIKANGEESSPKERLGGRPIGFRAWIGFGGITD